MIDLHPTTMECYRCGAATWERVETVTVTTKGRPHREEVVQCCFCGVYGRAEVVPDAPKPVATSGEFRFQFGRFEGLTLAEADQQENGRAYLIYMAETNDRLRERIVEYLAGTGLDRKEEGARLFGHHNCRERSDAA